MVPDGRRTAARFVCFQCAVLATPVMYSVVFSVLRSSKAGHTSRVCVALYTVPEAARRCQLASDANRLVQGARVDRAQSLFEALKEDGSFLDHFQSRTACFDIRRQHASRCECDTVSLFGMVWCKCIQSFSLLTRLGETGVALTCRTNAHASMKCISRFTNLRDSAKSRLGRLAGVVHLNCISCMHLTSAEPRMLPLG